MTSTNAGAGLSPSERAAKATQAHLAQFSDEDMAYHESGHAVIHHLNGGTVTRLSIDRDDPRRGCTTAPRTAAKPSADPNQALTTQIALLVGGDVAAALHGTPDDIATAGSRVDYDMAFRAAANAGIGTAQSHAMIDA